MIINLAEESVEKLLDMVKEGYELHLEFAPDETRVEVMPWRPFKYRCPFSSERGKSE